jgi:hypothetical protein
VRWIRCRGSQASNALGYYERNAIANIKTHPHLAELDKKTIDELEKVKRLDPEKLRIAICGNIQGNGP